MAYEMKSDLRVVKTRAAIKGAIKQMICEMPLSEITVKELTERAMIHRKTFYLHYESIEDLFEDLGNDVVQAYLARIEQLPPDAPYSEINAEFFKFMSEQEPYVEKIYCSPEYGDVLTRMLIDIIQHHKVKDSPYKNFPWEEQEIVNTYLVLGSVNIYRTWVRDGKLIPVDRLMELASKLMTQGIESVVKYRTRGLGRPRISGAWALPWRPRRTGPCLWTPASAGPACGRCLSLRRSGSCSPRRAHPSSRPPPSCGRRRRLL